MFIYFLKDIGQAHIIYLDHLLQSDNLKINLKETRKKLRLLGNKNDIEERECFKKIINAISM